MKNPQNITIMLLVISAAILTALLVGMQVYTTPQAQAGTSVRHQQSSYIVSVAHYSSSMDWVYVVDIKTRKINSYFADPQAKRIRLLDSTDLELVFRQAN